MAVVLYKSKNDQLNERLQKMEQIEEIQKMIATVNDQVQSSIILGQIGVFGHDNQVKKELEKHKQQLEQIDTYCMLNPTLSPEKKRSLSRNRGEPSEESLEGHKKKLEAQILVKKLKADQKQREINKILKEQKENEKMRSQEEAQKARQKEIQQLKEQERQKRREVTSLKRIQRLQESQSIEVQSKTKIKQIFSSKPLFQKLEHNYDEKVTKTALENQKQKLKEIRDFYKPIDKNELQQWNKDYTNIRRENSLKLSNDRSRSKNEWKQHQESLPYRINTHLIQREKSDSPQDQKYKKDKVNNYSKMVKQMYWPKVSASKQQETEVNKNKFKNPIISRSAQDLHTVPENHQNEYGITIQQKKVVGSYDRPWREAMSKNPSKNNEISMDSITRSPVYSQDNGKRELPPSKKIDYLAEMRQQTSRKNHKVQDRNKKFINQVLRDRKLNDFEKMEAVKRRADQIEEQARMKELVIQMEHRGDEDEYHPENVEKSMAINDMYVDAIQAKLKILEEI